MYLAREFSLAFVHGLVQGLVFSVVVVAIIRTMGWQ